MIMTNRYGDAIEVSENEDWIKITPNGSDMIDYSLRELIKELKEPSHLTLSSECGYEMYISKDDEHIILNISPDETITLSIEELIATAVHRLYIRTAIASFSYGENPKNVLVSQIIKTLEQIDRSVDDYYGLEKCWNVSFPILLEFNTAINQLRIDVQKLVRDDKSS